MSEILETLEKAEGRSQLDILSDLITSVPNAKVKGMIIRLSEGTHADYVTIMGFVVGKLRQIRVHLCQSEYDLARKAYYERLPIVCSGDLVRENGAFVLKNAGNFTLCDALTERPCVAQY